jgi:hypothetical protein
MNGTAKIDEKTEKGLSVNKLYLKKIKKYISLLKAINSRKQNVYVIFIFPMFFKTFQ